MDEAIQDELTSKKRGSIQISKELAADLLSASIKVSEVVETLEVQLDKETIRRLKRGEKEYGKGRFKTARTKQEIVKVLSN